MIQKGKWKGKQQGCEITASKTIVRVPKGKFIPLPEEQGSKWEQVQGGEGVASVHTKGLFSVCSYLLSGIRKAIMEEWDMYLCPLKPKVSFFCFTSLQ